MIVLLIILTELIEIENSGGLKHIRVLTVLVRQVNDLILGYSIVAVNRIQAGQVRDQFLAEDALVARTYHSQLCLC